MHIDCNWSALVTLKYTLNGGSEYLRGGDEGVPCEGELLFLVILQNKFYFFRFC